MQGRCQPLLLLLLLLLRTFHSGLTMSSSWMAESCSQQQWQ
jgi:hypothetical protein